MSPRDRDRRGGGIGLIIETFGTGNQAIKPKLASSENNRASDAPRACQVLANWGLSAFTCVHRRPFSFPGVTALWRSRLSFRRKNAACQSWIFPDWLRFATWCMAVAQPIGFFRK
jgi:hypothetical protein